MWRTLVALAGAPRDKPIMLANSMRQPSLANPMSHSLQTYAHKWASQGGRQAETQAGRQACKHTRMHTHLLSRHSRVHSHYIFVGMERSCERANVQNKRGSLCAPLRFLGDARLILICVSVRRLRRWRRRRRQLCGRWVDAGGRARAHVMQTSE